MERIARWFAYRLPRRVVYWCAIRLGAHATTGRFGHDIVSAVTFMAALARWDEDNDDYGAADA